MVVKGKDIAEEKKWVEQVNILILIFKPSKILNSVFRARQTKVKFKGMSN